MSVPSTRALKLPATNLTLYRLSCRPSPTPRSTLSLTSNCIPVEAVFHAQRCVSPAGRGSLSDKVYSHQACPARIDLLSNAAQTPTHCLVKHSYASSTCRSISSTPLQTACHVAGLTPAAQHPLFWTILLGQSSFVDLAV